MKRIHPLREGNGRTQEFFFSLTALRFGWQLDWSRVGKTEVDAASIAGSADNLAPLRAMFERVVVRR